MVMDTLQKMTGQLSGIPTLKFKAVSIERAVEILRFDELQLYARLDVNNAMAYTLVSEGNSRKFYTSLNLLTKDGMP